MSKNDITGDTIITDVPSAKFSNGWDAIWGNKVQAVPEPIPNEVSNEQIELN